MKFLQKFWVHLISTTFFSAKKVAKKLSAEKISLKERAFT